VGIAAAARLAELLEADREGECCGSRGQFVGDARVEVLPPGVEL